jgi:integrase/recombinase XerD
MAKRGGRKKREETQDSRTAMKASVSEYIEWMQVTNYSEHTVKDHRINLGYFCDWCEERGLTEASEVTRAVLDLYQKWVYRYRTKEGKPLTFSSQTHRLSPLRGFFKWMSRKHLILYNPAAELELPRVEKRLPRFVLSACEADRVIDGVNTTGPLGLRDRAVLETLYSTGMRRRELIGLAICDLDRERGTVMIRQGKGRKDRMVPIGERALAWIGKYLVDGRPHLAVEPDEGILFLTSLGEALSPNRLSNLVGAHVRASGIEKSGACHLFRHTMATLMLESGADIRSIQEILGHAELTSTQTYTRVSIRRLKEVHDKTHPGAHLKTAEGRKEHDSSGDGPDVREALLSALAAEADEDGE